MGFNPVELLKNQFLSALSLISHNSTYTIQQGLAKGLKRKGGLAFLPRRSPPTREEEFLLSQQFANQVVYDVGGFEGIFTLFFARAVGPTGKVFTFEPNPLNQQTIRTNVAVNHFQNVTIFPVGIGKEPLETSMCFDPTCTATGSLNPQIKQQLQQQDGTITIPVRINTVDRLIETRHLPPPNFLKIDVEGFEYDVLQGMVHTLDNHAPRLFIEIHGLEAQSKIQNIQQVVKFLLAHNYEILHVETNTKIRQENAPVAQEGHIFCCRK